MCTFPSSVRREGQGADTPGARSTPGPRSPSPEGPRPLGETADRSWGGGGGGVREDPARVVMPERASELRKPEGTRHRAWRGRAGPHGPAWGSVCAEVMEEGHTSRTTGKQPPASVPATGAWAGTETCPLRSGRRGPAGRVWGEWRRRRAQCPRPPERGVPAGISSGGCRQGHPRESDAGLLGAGGPADTWRRGPVGRGRQGGHSGETAVTGAHSGRPAGSSGGSHGLLVCPETQLTGTGSQSPPNVGGWAVMPVRTPGAEGWAPQVFFP